MIVFPHIRYCNSPSTTEIALDEVYFRLIHFFPVNTLVLAIPVNMSPSWTGEWTSTAVKEEQNLNIKDKHLLFVSQ